ncbi:LysR substrate-binding domain-containing protein [Roseinatronobacter sp. S2]|uniref:LysR substrate-binding domain-containing protein n=1 Tax=Roseinatronobacter sp. S2 TaxID=3035471 RepID=UPI00240EDF22|nr:LysR substrate-binding domain-containing protein [Roseinatronobacter sp. S2]WFE76398.1 LysR substrate-binding domain-containing protein [Roseinatronobacter sp. S2]
MTLSPARLTGLPGSAKSEILKVGVVTTFAVGWLLPHLAAFQRSHPAIDLRISTNNNRVVILRRSYRDDEWPRWFAGGEGACPPLTGPIFESSVAIANIAVDGGGVALLPVAMFTRHIDERRLVQPFAARVAAGSYYLT